MKICYTCKMEKDKCEFSDNKYKKDGLNSNCKICHAEYRKVHYIKNKEKARRQINERKAEMKKWFNELKSQLTCEVCGEDRTWVLDFHHKNKDDKEIEISLAAAKGWGKKRIQKEIDKCSILCSNCHRDLHYQERNASIVSAA